MPASSDLASDGPETRSPYPRQNLARRVYPIRVVALAAGSLPQAVLLHEQQAAPLTWLLLILSAVIWPHVAYQLARRAPDPTAVEVRNMTIDSIQGGFWIGATGFCLLPSMIYTSLLAMDKLSIGGWRLLVRAVTVQALGALAGWLLFGLPFNPVTSQAVMLACLPNLLFYPLAIGTMNYRMTQRLVEQRTLLRQLNRQDSLTGIANRRHWDETVSAELNRHRRTERPACLLMIDIDDFKSINDDHGHSVGDAVIRQVASVLRDCSRDIDTPCRYGGDEFCVVVPESDHNRAIELAERIRLSISAMVIDGLRRVPTVSVGIAQIDAEVPDPRRWIENADAALYRAKANGRNRTEVWSPEGRGLDTPATA